VTDADAVLALESPVLTLAIVVNVYAVPAVRPEMVHDPDAPSTVHFAPPGVAVTSYDVGATPPVGAVTVMVALSSPATTVGTPGVFGTITFARAVTAGEAGLRAVEPPALSYALTANVYAVPAVRFAIMQDPDAPSISHRPLPGVA
jgi:predicted ThiF/HesA family dinucleotide-utilizing enzyme